jgi:predicted phage terminase large subunit-like protein
VSESQENPLGRTKERTSLAMHYDALMSRRRFKLPPHLYPFTKGIEDDRIPFLLAIGPPGLGKALRHGTPILTSTGWKAIENIVVGDEVVHPSGYFTKVVATSRTPSMPLWRVHFGDGRTLDAHGNHLWRIHHKNIGVRRVELFAAEGKRVRARIRETEVGQAWKNMTSDALADLMTRQPSLRCFVPLPEAINLPDIPLWRGLGRTNKPKVRGLLTKYNPQTQMALPPYLLGCILGDGYITDDGTSTVTTSDAEMEHLLRADARLVGLNVTPRVTVKEHCPVWRVLGAAPRIRALGLANARSHTKFIPSVYFKGSVAQRLALLQGLFDTDGYVNAGGSPDFTTTSRTLAEGVQRLIWSLGGKAKITVHCKTFVHKGERRTGKPAYRVAVQVRDPWNFFRLTRKKEKTWKSQYADTFKLHIERIERIDAAKSACIQVEAEDGMFLAGDFVPTHNSTLLGIALPTWFLGNQPDLTILGVSAGESLIKKQIKACMEIIQHSPEFHQLYPDVKPDMQSGWSAENGINVTGHLLGDQDPSYVSAGLASKALTGAHARVLIWDDLHDKINSNTVEGRQEVVKTAYDTLLGRADPQGSRFIAIGRRWATDDLYGKLQASGLWVVMHLPALRRGEKRLWWDVYVPKDVECVFSETLEEDKTYVDPNGLLRRFRAYYGADPTGEGFYWPNSKQKRMEYMAVARENPGVVETTYNGYPERDEGRVFEASDFKPYVPPEDLHLGIAAPSVLQWVRGSRGYMMQAWDTALGKKYSESRTVALAGLLVPCRDWHCGEDVDTHGPCPHHYDVYLTDRFYESVDFRKLLKVFRDRHEKWGARKEVIEDKASGTDLMQLLKGGNIPIEGRQVREGKVERAVNGVGGGGASVQGWGRMGRIRYPLDAPWIKPFLENVLSFTGDETQRSDDFDTLVHLVSAAIEASRKGGRILQGDSPNPWSNQETVSDITDPRRYMMDGFTTLAYQEQVRASRLATAGSTPFDGMCGSCGSYDFKDGERWCSLNDHKTAAIHGCRGWHRAGTPPPGQDQLKTRRWVV